VSDRSMRVFIDELLEAMEGATRENDLAPVQRVIGAWYRTLVLRSDPHYAANLQAAGDPDRGEAFTIDDLRARYATS
jgi:Family of unknown function (DUF6247)